MSSMKLRRSTSDKVLAGVCGGIAEYFDIPAILVRLLFLFSGIGILPYLLMAVFIPEDYA
jgi:phage shock protein C